MRVAIAVTLDKEEQVRKIALPEQYFERGRATQGQLTVFGS